MKILIFILIIIMNTAFYTAMKLEAERRSKDLFSWGYYTGIILAFAVYLILK